MFNANVQFLKSLSDYMGTPIKSRKQIEDLKFTPYDLEQFAIRYHEDMSMDEIRKDARVIKIFYFCLGVVATIGTIFYKLSNPN